MWLIDQLYVKLVLSFEYKGLPPWHRNTWDARSWLLGKLMSTCLQQLSQGLFEMQLKKEMLFTRKYFRKIVGLIWRPDWVMCNFCGTMVYMTILSFDWIWLIISQVINYLSFLILSTLLVQIKRQNKKDGILYKPAYNKPDTRGKRPMTI